MMFQTVTLNRKLSGYVKIPILSLRPVITEGCHHLPLGRNSTNENKQVIKKFVNMLQPELMLNLKKNISSKSKVYINNLLCPKYYHFPWEKCKDLQRKGNVNQVFLSWSSRNF